MVVFLNPFDRMMSGDVSGLSSAGLEQLVALSKLADGNSYVRKAQVCMDPSMWLSGISVFG
jgi:hypothetical protein